MSNKWGVKPEQADVLIELEGKIEKSIPLVSKIKLKTIGVEIHVARNYRN